MPRIKEGYIEKIYAGWLAKIIGIRMGAPVEGWSYEKIKNVYGSLQSYPFDYKEFAADDDSNGPFFFLRALEDRKSGHELTAQDVAEAFLNYVPFEHGFFWWGGYGIATEHTAYLNLRNGIPAPRSGSILQNGTIIAEQIGGQIFVDTWGLVAPGNPDLAAKYAETAASVTHDRNGIYGGVFVAACISCAFDETDIRTIIKKGLSYIPDNSEYANVVRAVMAYHDERRGNWRDCYAYVRDHFGYDKYTGCCHIIPNIAVMIVALMYGGGDFSNTLNICNMCGWDTDCNVGNLAVIMGVREGLAAIDYEKWRKPINDLLVCSSVVGALNLQDIPFGAAYIAKLAYDVAGEIPPAPWDKILYKRQDSCHFEYPGSTHAFRVKTACTQKQACFSIINTDEAARSGKRSLKVFAHCLEKGSRIYLYKKTYYTPGDFYDSRYDPSFSPLVYPGQTIHGSLYLPSYGHNCTARLYVRDHKTGAIYESDPVNLITEKWTDLALTIPSMPNILIDEAGFAIDAHGQYHAEVEICVCADDFYFSGAANYSLDMSHAWEEFWHTKHIEISQFTKLKGIFYLEDNLLHISCSDFGEAYTGHYKWTDYTTDFALTPIAGERHLILVRVQGAIRSYAAGLIEGGKLAIFKNENGYRKISEVDFAWQHGKEVVLRVTANSDTITVAVDELHILSVTDSEQPYLCGAIGLAVQNGSHCSVRYIKVCPI